MVDDLLFEFLEDDENHTSAYEGSYKILIVDDDVEVHTVTRLMLEHFTFNNHNLEIIDVYSGKETKAYLDLHSDVAVIFLDVVMESNQAGLEVVKYLRDVLNNEMTRIILRTGQPGEAPEERIIREYDINDYRLKTDLTIERLNSSLITALRSYSYILRIENNRKGLEKIVDASSNLFKHNTMEDFFKTILEQLSSFHENPTDLIYMKEDSNGFITKSQEGMPEIVAGTGKYEAYVGRYLGDVEVLESVYSCIQAHQNDNKQVQMIDKGILIKKSDENMVKNYIYIESNDFKFDLNLINVFMSNYSSALESYDGTSQTKNNQNEMMMILVNAIEEQFEESGHLKRVSDMMYKFARLQKLSLSESEAIKNASILHDVGDTIISKTLLKKSTPLSKEEFNIIKSHTTIGHELLSKVKSKTMEIASEIALSHHERFDGMGYPNGLTGNDIPLSARMMTIVDVFDVMTHNRVYKTAESVELALEYIKDNSGSQFDPMLALLFINNHQEIIG